MKHLKCKNTYWGRKKWMESLSIEEQTIVDNLHQLSLEKHCNGNPNLIIKKKERFYKLVKFIHDLIEQYNEKAMWKFHILQENYENKGVTRAKYKINKSSRSDKAYLDSFTIMCVKPLEPNDEEFYKPVQTDKKGQILMQF